MKKYSLLFSALLITTLPVAAHADNAFTGPYVGLSAGYVAGQDRNREYDPYPSTTGYTAETQPNGALFGLTGGYNMTVPGHDNLVMGLQADLEFRTNDDKSLYLNNGTPDPQYPIKTDVKYVASLLPRLGYIFNGGRTLASGGVGISTARIERTYYDAAAPASSSATKNQLGWVAALGVEHFLTNDISLQAEGRYADYGTRKMNASVFSATDVEQQSYDEFSLRTAVMYHF